MPKVSWRSRNAPTSPNDSSSVEQPESSPASVDDRIPESWRSLIELKAPSRELPRANPRVETPRPVAQAETTRRPRISVAWATAAVLALVVVIQNAFIARRMVADSARVVPTLSLPVTISSGSVGDAVTIDGRQVGVTPYQLRVDESIHEVRVLGSQPPVPEPAAEPPRTEPAFNPLVRSAPSSGGLKLSAPVDVQVLEGDRVLGSSADGPVIAAAGVHQFDLVNSEIGYRERRRVEIKAGQIIALTVTPPNGRLNINALPWAQVWIDGKEAGETPLANVSLPGGPHDVVFRHPQLGERTERVIVKSGGLARLSITLSR